MSLAAKELLASARACRYSILKSSDDAESGVGNIDELSPHAMKNVAKTNRAAGVAIVLVRAEK